MRINDSQIDNIVELLWDALPSIEKDAFNYKEIALDISNTIRIARPPFVYAICGTWGSGKSTILKFLLNFLPSSDEKSLVVYFNALRASINSNFLAVLVKEIIDQINESKIIKKSRFRDKLKSTGKSLVKASIESFSELNPATKFIYGFYTKLKKNNLNEFRRTLDAQNRVRDKFEEISKILGEEGLTAFVFIDELDRCSPHIVIQIIEAIRMVFGNHDELSYEIRSRNRQGNYNFNLLPKIPFKYILTIDEDYVARAFSSYYNLEIDEAHMYLSKFIQLKYHFPNRNWTKFVENVLNLISSKELRDKFLPNGYIEDFSNFLLYFNIESPRDAHRILAYLILWQKRFFVREFHTSIIQIIEKISEDDDIRKTFISAVNCIFIFFAILKVKFPSLVPTILKENVIPKICKTPEEANKELNQFEGILGDIKLRENLINPIKKLIDYMKEKFQDIKIEHPYNYLEKIAIDLMNR